jgi:cytochrome c556
VRAAARATAWLAAAGATLLCACPAPTRYRERLEEAPAPQRHAVHSERLEELMGGLRRLLEERLPQAMDVEAQRAVQAEEIGKVARALARSARRIPTVAPQDLSPTQREEIWRRSEDLARHADTLAADAARLDATALRARVETLHATCAGCHRTLGIEGALDGDG